MELRPGKPEGLVASQVRTVNVNCPDAACVELQVAAPVVERLLELFAVDVGPAAFDREQRGVGFQDGVEFGRGEFDVTQRDGEFEP